MNERPPKTVSPILAETLEMPQLPYEVSDGDSTNSLLLLKYILMLFPWISRKMFMKLIQYQVQTQAIEQASNGFH